MANGSTRVDYDVVASLYDSGPGLDLLTERLPAANQMILPFRGDRGIQGIGVGAERSSFRRSRGAVSKSTIGWSYAARPRLHARACTHLVKDSMTLDGTVFAVPKFWLQNYVDLTIGPIRID